MIPPSRCASWRWSSKLVAAEPAVEETDRFEPRFDGDGLIPAFVCDAENGEPLMFAWMNREALQATLRTGEAHFWSRSRSCLWHKGAQSGNVLRLVEMRTDCDQDVVHLAVTVVGHGAACHTGRRSCFYRRVEANGTLSFTRDAPRFDPDAVYAR